MFQIDGNKLDETPYLIPYTIILKNKLTHLGLVNFNVRGIIEYKKVGRFFKTVKF